jgi:CHASE2 domain-containing sensor protein
MAVVDSALVISDQLQKPNSVLNAAHPAASLPRLQTAVFGSAVMGYGDLFVAGALGGLLAVHASRDRQLAASLLVAALALGLDLLFFVANELPATVPVALALVLLSAWQSLMHPPARWRRRERQRVTAQGAGG